jgi:hypothetical protein
MPALSGGAASAALSGRLTKHLSAVTWFWTALRFARWSRSPTITRYPKGEVQLPDIAVLVMRAGAVEVRLAVVGAVLDRGRNRLGLHRLGVADVTNSALWTFIARSHHGAACDTQKEGS